MGATRIPVIPNPGNDPGRNQPRKQAPDSTDARSGTHHDPESMMENPGGAATIYKRWSTEANEQASYNGPAPRDRGNRSV